MNRSLFPLPALALVAAAGCTDRAPLAPPTHDAAALQVSAATALVPFHGEFSGLPDASIPRAVCTPPAGSSTPLRLQGPLAHGGLSTVDAVFCSTITGVTFPTAFVSQAGTLTLRVANGDAINLLVENGQTQVNLNCSTLTTVNHPIQVVGGTGRFEGASGSATFTGTQVPAACPQDHDPPRFFVTGTLEGWISTVGSKNF